MLHTTEKFENWLKNLAWLQFFWTWVKDIGAVLKPCRFSVIMLVVGFLFLFVSAQGQDVLRVMVEGARDGRKLILWFWFFIAMCLWGVNAWYWAEVMLRCRFPNDRRFDQTEPSRRKRINWLSRHTPRVLGVLCFMTTAVSFARAAMAITPVEGANTATNLAIFAGFSAALGLAFWVLVIYRGSMIMTAANTLENTRFRNQARQLRDSATEMADSDSQAHIEKLRHFHPGTLWALALFALLAFALFLVFAINPQVADFFGSASILLLAAATWIPFGSTLVYFGSRYKMPVLSLFLGSAVVFSFFNDNHKLRAFEHKAPERPQLSAHFENWLNSRKPVKDGPPQPIYLAAAEGGGIRAAYWTAMVLSALHDIDQDFGRNLYAISGVSGGSLGAAAFVALLKEQELKKQALKEQAGNQQHSCVNDSLSADAAGSLQVCAEAVLGQDFLSPTVAAMLYPDLTQRFLFWPVGSFDRARALEKSWEKSWQDNIKSDQFAGPFGDLWTAGVSVPALFLNGTWVRTGRRIITSNIRIDDAYFADAVDFFDVHPKAIPLSTAAHNSARFTYVSPAGLIENSKGRWGRIVDGGYFENSGATTAAEIFNAMSSKMTDQENLLPVFFMITNNRDQCTGTECEDPEPAKFLTEALSPLTSILKTREARGGQARATMRTLVESRCGLYIEIGLQGAEGPLPLGWVMSGTAHEIMRRMLLERLRPLQDGINPAALKALAGANGAEAHCAP